jgi:hypothetical protein
MLGIRFIGPTACPVYSAVALLGTYNKNLYRLGIVQSLLSPLLHCSSSDFKYSPCNNLRGKNQKHSPVIAGDSNIAKLHADLNIIKPVLYSE